MEYSLVVVTEAEEDLAIAKDWYDTHAGIGNAFIDDVSRVLESVVSFPNYGPVVFEEVHQALLRRFPYKVMYRIDGRQIIVLAVTHHARNDEPWRSR